MQMNYWSLVISIMALQPSVSPWHVLHSCVLAVDIYIIYTATGASLTAGQRDRYGLGARNHCYSVDGRHHLQKIES